METRDKQMPQEHFFELIKRSNERIVERVEELKTTDDPKTHAGYRGGIAREYRDILWAAYSAGYRMEDLKMFYKNWVLNYLHSDVIDMSGSRNPGMMLSFAILFGRDDEEWLSVLQQVLDIVPNKDPFVTFLADYLGLQSENPKPHKSWCKWYLKVRDIENKTEQEVITEEYLRRWWYKSNQSEAWWGRLQAENRQWLYGGYWAFEIAAGVRVLGLDDSSFCDNKYYPCELAHYLDEKELRNGI